MARSSLLLIAALAVTLPVGVAPRVVRAHSARLGMATQKVTLKLASPRRRLVFQGYGDGLVPTYQEDPRSVGATVLVMAHGEGEGRTQAIRLDAARWSSRAKGGFVYRDEKGTRGGVKRIVYKDGVLVIKAGGARLAWIGDEAPHTVEVLFGVGEEWHCASAPVVASPKGFQAKNAPAPLHCAPILCGNGKRELGEFCDDGNFDDADTCTMACALTDCEGPAYASTWAALQDLVFAPHGCTSPICHGASPGAGDLDLTPANAYRQLIDVPSSGSAYPRVVPGGPRRSALFLKLAAGRDPEGVDIPGAPMPSGLPPLTETELEAVRTWIQQGAPETGVVEGTRELLDACTPPPSPIEIEPLEPPAPSEGVQLRMPPFRLPAASETEVCFSSYYDLTDQIPPEFVDPSGDYFYSAGSELRQDPHSHHLQIIFSGVPTSLLGDYVFGEWTCKGGERAGAPCEPTDLAFCGDGLCGSTPRPSVACIGYGPIGYQPGIVGNTIGGAQTSQFYAPGVPGFYGLLPIRGVLYWNSHAFNLTDQGTDMHAYTNYFFASDRRFLTEHFTTIDTVFFPAGIAAFSTGTVCADFEMPEGSHLLTLTSHTHKRGKHFWVDHPDGSRIFENFDYADPTTATFDPPLPFTASDPAARTLHYCATYNNGVAGDGSPDPTTVRRRSVTPSNGTPCDPTACVAGRIGAPCSWTGAAAHRSCDSTEGAGDGSCDACPITAGVTTEDDMFILIGTFVAGPIE